MEIQEIVSKLSPTQKARLKEVFSTFSKDFIAKWTPTRPEDTTAIYLAKNNLIDKFNESVSSDTLPLTEDYSSSTESYPKLGKSHTSVAYKASGTTLEDYYKSDTVLSSISACVNCKYFLGWGVTYTDSRCALVEGSVKGLDVCNLFEAKYMVPTSTTTESSTPKETEKLSTPDAKE